MPTIERSRSRALHLFAGSAFAIAQPLYDLLARNAGFLVAHDLSPAEIVALAVGLWIGVPLAAWAIEAAASLPAPKLGWGVHLGFMASFAAITALPAMARAAGLPADAAIAAAIATGVLAAVGYARWRPVRRFTSVLALAGPFFAVWFLTRPPVTTLLSGPPEAFTADFEMADKAPIIMIFFDELPTASLLDDNDRIDPVRYPNFARLARGSTWFRNATTVHAQTHLAVPAMLTGRYSPPTFVPIASAHPENLFRLLDPMYDMNVYEEETALLPDASNDRETITRASGPRLATFASDLWILFLHTVLPEARTRGLPPIDATWREFAHDEPRQRPAPGSYRVRDVRFRAFIASIAPRARPTLHFYHALLPHTPFNFLPSGRRYYPLDNFGQTKQTWGEEPWWVDQAYQRHLLQVAFVDRLLGELLDRLEETGLYDPALIVVAADHGGGFWPGEARRNPVLARHPEDVLRIPLFVKAPNQRLGRVSDRNVETIDLLPTIADQLGFRVPWRMHGCSALGPACAERDGKVFVTSLGKHHRFALDRILDRASLERKLALFGTGAQSADLQRRGRYHALVGHPVTELALSGSATRVRAHLRPEPFRLAAERPEQFTLARITGELLGVAPGPAPRVAIAVDGVVAAIAPALPQAGPGLLFSAMLPERLAPADAERLELLLVRGAPGAARLQRLPTTIGVDPIRSKSARAEVDRK